MFSLSPWKKREGMSMPIRGDRDDNSRLSRLREEVEALWDYFWKEMDRGFVTGMGSSQQQWHTNWKETECEYLFHAELPGFDASELDVKVAGNVVTVHAEHKQESKTEQGATYRYGTYHQSFPVPHGVANDRIEASFRNGMLEIRLPKSEEGRGRRISVQSS